MVGSRDSRDNVSLPLAAIPFLVVGLPLRWAEVSAAIIFPLAIMFYVFVMKPHRCRVAMNYKFSGFKALRH